MSSRGSPEPGKGHINISTSLPTTYRRENKPKMPYSRELLVNPLILISSQFCLAREWILTSLFHVNFNRRVLELFGCYKDLIYFKEKCTYICIYFLIELVFYFVTFKVLFSYSTFAFTHSTCDFKVSTY